MVGTTLWGALAALAFFVVARVMAGNGGTTPLPLERALAGLAPERLGLVALLGAAAGLALRLLRRLLPPGPRRALGGGLVAGALAVVVFHQSSLFVLHQAFRLVPERGFLFAPLPGIEIPALYALMVAGALGGAFLSQMLRWVHALPDLLCGALLGAFGLSLLGQLPGVPGFGAPWWQWALINGGWGWGTAFLLRPLALRGGEGRHGARAAG
ncbi:hypothetical protein CR162_16640 [Pseudoroseomonas rhizosphaerae]|uniref:Uncharacterized protein n=1 Tax=Teichococcus rhizosphaerae TaxID=1335062 RepID=A0A2C7A6Y3_9PROT|nr:hypothetical protein [Pseudoroseomonas rhizosphaerae]PHK93749.1 hypothetical protein CR162_16640 [Pseudoroseomonas rhizosphaerae]